MRERLSDEQLESALRELGAALRYPPTHDLLPAVRARITQPVKRPSLWDALRVPRFAYAPALATLAIILVAALALQPGVRATAIEVLGLRGIEIFRAPTPPTAAPAGAPRLGDARRVGSVGEAASIADIRVFVPAALGAPDEVYVRNEQLGGGVTLVYLTRPGIPVSQFAGVSVLVTEVRGSVEPAFFAKVLPPGTQAEEVRINGARGFWLAGAPHSVFYRDASGNAIAETLRLAGNVLLWEQGDLLLRIEAQIDRDEALRIATSMR